MRIYYAHHIWKYNTKVEEYELDLINNHFKNVEIVNPNGGLGYTELSGLTDIKIIDICFKAIKSCDTIVFSSISGIIGLGICKEVLLGEEIGLQIFYIYNNKLIPIDKFNFDIIQNSSTKKIFATVNL